MLQSNHTILPASPVLSYLGTLDHFLPISRIPSFLPTICWRPPRASSFMLEAASCIKLSLISLDEIWYLSFLNPQSSFSHMVRISTILYLPFTIIIIRLWLILFFSSCKFSEDKDDGLFLLSTYPSTLYMYIYIHTHTHHTHHNVQGLMNSLLKHPSLCSLLCIYSLGNIH